MLSGASPSVTDALIVTSPGVVGALVTRTDTVLFDWPQLLVTVSVNDNVVSTSTVGAVNCATAVLASCNSTTGLPLCCQWKDKGCPAGSLLAEPSSTTSSPSMS